MTNDDVVFADEDGVLFVPLAQVDDVLAAAERIRDTERAQAARVREGRSLRQQLGFAAYLREREKRPELTFREYLRTVGGAIEE